MKRFALLLLILTFAGCGSDQKLGQVESSPGVESEAWIEPSRPVKISELLAWARGHGIELKELNAEYAFKTETISTGVAVQPGQTDSETERAFREETESVLEGVGSDLDSDPEITAEQRANVAAARKQAASGSARVVSFNATGSAKTLRALKDDPLVKHVFVRP